MYNQPFNSAEERYDAYERYLASKRVNIAPMLGTNVCLSTITLGVVEAAQPRMDYIDKSRETYNRPLGETALATVTDINEYRRAKETRQDAVNFAQSREYAIAS